MTRRHFNDQTKRHLAAIAEGQRNRMTAAKGNGRPTAPTPEQQAMMMAQQRAAAMMMRRETLSGIILNGMLAGMNWQPNGQPYPPEDAAELARDAVTFAEALLMALYPPPAPAANADQVEGQPGAPASGAATGDAPQPAAEISGGSTPPAEVAPPSPASVEELDKDTIQAATTLVGGG